ncbi:hypothetical protein CTI12_AA014300 [Artemisia annua]|uniref:MSP domain-containing protein n=1 Tax=Artemisia annua TaxID=35608 RepID=A0A2U1QLT2_ARTAN|nr:hypothetical protein CTI12_AA014300 [Artemisia annua]
MKSSIIARVSAIVKKGFCFKAKDYGLVESAEYKLKFNPKKVRTWIPTFTNNSDYPHAYIIKTSHPDLYYIKPNTFIVKPHTTCAVTITRMVQDQVLIAEEKIFIDNIRVPIGTSAKDIKSIFRFKGKGYIVKTPKLCLADVDPMILETRSEVAVRDLRRVTIVRSLFDYN